MNARRAGRGDTLVELGGDRHHRGRDSILIPAVNSAREAAQGQLLTETQLGVEMQNYTSTFNNTFPPSASLAKAPDGTTQTVGGWSFLVRLLPFMEYDALGPCPPKATRRTPQTRRLLRP